NYQNRKTGEIEVWLIDKTPEDENPVTEATLEFRQNRTLGIFSSVFNEETVAKVEETSEETSSEGDSPTTDSEKKAQFVQRYKVEWDTAGKNATYQKISKDTK
ncbi:MAG: hypothetical protein Q4C70_11750, partial [Planctomycetia bacterium]|nr:hypothetical protein [Planctomycetia bacterium]